MNGSMSELSKMTVVNTLLRACYPARFLELSTPGTGYEFNQTRTELCARADLAKYRVQADREGPRGADKAHIEDGSPTSGVLVESILRLIGDRPGYDVILADPHHSYEDSLNDLRSAWRLLVPGGTLVVHDCNPATAQHASPLETEGIWCGRTFEAFLDFVRCDELPYFTIDADYGIGVILKDGNRCGGHPFESQFKPMNPVGRAIWDGTPPEGDRFCALDQHRVDLLNLVPQDAFASVLSELENRSSDVGENQPEASRLRRVGTVPRTEWTRGRTQAEVLGRFEEMVGRWEAHRAADERHRSVLEAQIDRQQKLIEHMSCSDSRWATEVERCETRVQKAEEELDWLRLDLLTSREALLLANQELEEQAAEVSELGSLLVERTTKLLSLELSSTFRLRAFALRARPPIVLWRTGAALATRFRMVHSNRRP